MKPPITYECGLNLEELQELSKKVAKLLKYDLNAKVLDFGATNDIKHSVNKMFGPFPPHDAKCQMYFKIKMVDNDDLISLSPMRDDLSVINFLNDLLNNGKTTDKNQKVGFA